MPYLVAWQQKVNQEKTLGGTIRELKAPHYPRSVMRVWKHCWPHANWGPKLNVAGFACFADFLFDCMNAARLFQL